MRVAMIAVPGGVFLTVVLWWMVEHLSPDAVAMAARRRDDEDDWQPTIIDNPQPVYSDQVTGYTHLFRRAAGMPALPDRQAEIDNLRSALDYIEAQEIHR